MFVMFWAVVTSMAIELVAQGSRYHMMGGIADDPSWVERIGQHLSLEKVAFDMGETHFDGVELRAVQRQINDLESRFFTETSNLGSTVN
jgi:hypothetical protein